MRAAWFPLLALGVAAACGGRTNATPTSDVDETTLVGGSANAKQGEPGAAGTAPSSSGSGNAVSASGTAASSGGTGSGTGGQASAAGAPTLGMAGAATCSCEQELECEPGFVMSYEPERCCRCVLDCPSVGCLELTCPDGQHPWLADDDCCPSCVIDSPLTCEQARQKYDDLRTELLARPETVSCSEDADCAHLLEDNLCQLTCGTPVAVAQLDALDEELSSFAEHCASCAKQLPAKPCPRPKPAVCVDGVCQ